MIECPRCSREIENDARFCVGCGENLSKINNDRKRKETYIGQVLEGKYMVLDRIGDGGMGTVYKAEQLSLNKNVAIKILHRNLLQNETQVKRFQREAWSASRLDHPNSISIIDFGKTEDDCQFIVMEYLKGQELSEIINCEQPIDQKRIVHILSQVLGVLHEAHGQKIIHRDLKPENIMLIKRAEQHDYVKVLDFGIAKLHERDPNTPALTMQGVVCGTPEYMSPEQAMGKDLDPRTDIYSIGCILYEMLTGRVPFCAGNYQAILGMHIRDDATRPSIVKPDYNISPKLEEVAIMAMQKDKALRFADAMSMKRALEVALRSEATDVVNPPIQAVNTGSKTLMMGSEFVTLNENVKENQATLPTKPASELFDMPTPEQTKSGQDFLTKNTPPPQRPLTIEEEEILELDDDRSYFDEPPTVDDFPDIQPENSKKGFKIFGILFVLLVAIAAVAYAIDADKMFDQKDATDKTKQEITALNVDSAKTVEEKTVIKKPEKNVEPKKEKSKAKTSTKRKATKKLSKTEKLKLAESYYKKGNKAFSSGKLVSAIRFYLKAKKYNPASATVYKKLGLSYLKKGDRKNAKKYFGTYLKKAPHSTDAARIKELHESL